MNELTGGDIARLTEGAPNNTARSAEGAPSSTAGAPANTITAMDDAAVWELPDGRSLVSTVDFFTPIVDDPRVWGAIAAANAASDVYAMGAQPLFALNVAAWPRDELPLDLLAEVMAGGAATARNGGWLVVGGHSVDAPEPMYGMAVTGEVLRGAPLRLGGATAGEAIVLTKPLGTGVLATALKASAAAPEADSTDALGRCYRAGVAEMTRLNAQAAQAARAAGATACTDVTGFGLLGHLLELTEASGVAARVDAASVPVLPGALELLRAGMVAGGTRRNAEAAAGRCTIGRATLEGGTAASSTAKPSGAATDADNELMLLLSDAQTSGGLLFTCPQHAAAAAVSQLNEQGHTAAVIGEVVPQQPTEGSHPASQVQIEGALGEPFAAAGS